MRGGSSQGAAAVGQGEARCDNRWAEVAIAGVGLVMWHYLGPDLRRYLKIHAM